MPDRTVELPVLLRPQGSQKDNRRHQELDEHTSFYDGYDKIESNVKETEPGAPESPDEKEPMLYCPVCGTRLTALKCKLLCEKCGYYMSCSDYR